MKAHRGGELLHMVRTMGDSLKEASKELGLKEGQAQEWLWGQQDSMWWVGPSPADHRHQGLEGSVALAWILQVSHSA